MFQTHTGNKPLIAAHRGSCGGNIPPNTMAAMEAACRFGADILEMDVARSRDGAYFLFHTGNEAFYLNLNVDFEQTDAVVLRELPLNNDFRKPTQYHLALFDDVLEQFKGRCILNLDRCWQYWGELIPLIERHAMREQILLKSPCREQWLRAYRELAQGYAYLPIVDDSCEDFLCGGFRRPEYIGAELVFASEDSAILQNAIVEKLHRIGKLAWGNAIQFSSRKILSAGHTDDVSITASPELGWGWLIEHGFDIIQTDWVLALHTYLKTRNCALPAETACDRMETSE